ncbi:diacylglycerol kinase epsilon, partial [Diaphorina citri]|uniref:Diacylglycerol kinase n=1 Tax=Diaphorina citri TaxID=121845 RepID=A0A1S3DK26_DIACI
METNKRFLYLTFGTQQAMERGCRDLDQRIELYLDGERVDLPPIESVVVLNIPSWASGVDLWKLGRGNRKSGNGDGSHILSTFRRLLTIGKHGANNQGNRKSGNGDGSHILSTFRRLLNPLQVVDLADKSPEEALQWVSLMPSSGQTLILAAGGDGTAAWILNTIHNMKLDPAPSVGIIPLGTGNDLSRVLGWGKLYDRDTCSPFQILDNLTRSKVAHLDRWSVQIKSIRQLRLTRALKCRWMYNYLSIGVDAQVALDFHNTRESSLYIFSSRAFNKFLYLTFGTQQAMERGCRDLDQRIELYLDGERVDLPPIESVVVLNIPSWASGVDLWKLGRDSEDGMGDSLEQDQKIDDSKIEV